ncbi:MAG: aminopeptidase P family protein [Bacteroidales bacterium]|nr:aminopeptidase P family protein [Bacteroidales bacterium]MDD4528932.1 aminopeptidase P family protein [Bacteroidales bacterium]
MFSRNTYIERRKQLAKDVKDGIILILGNSDAPFNYLANIYTFRQDSSFRYFFEYNLADLAGVIDANSSEDYLFGDDVEIDDIIWTGPVASIKERAEKIGVKNSGSRKDLANLLQEAILKGRKIHFLPPYRTENRNLLSSLLFIKKDHVEKFASLELRKAIVKQRSIKSLEEVLEIEKALETAYQMHTTMMKMAKHIGTYEYEIAGKMEGIALSGGGPVSFPIILTTHGEILHGHDHSQQLMKGRMLVSDAGCETPSGYCSDITRTVPCGGKFDNRQKEVYQAVLNANLAAQKAIKPGVEYKEIHLLAVKTLGEGLKSIGLMKGDIDQAVQEGAMGLFMPHGLGHMMGMDVHDMENFDESIVGYDEKTSRSTQFGLRSLRFGRGLQQGMVITNEPGCYFIPALIDKFKSENKFKSYINYKELENYKDFGGIRIEDDILVTDKSSRVLGTPIPKTIKDIEEIME